MHPNHPTIGFVSTWSVYEGTTIDRYTHTLLRGICAAAADRNCNLLLSCGIGLPGTPRSSRTAWPLPDPGVDFLPVGPWNTDGLIIIPDDLSDSQHEFIQGLVEQKFPVILTTTEKGGPVVAVDNQTGIQRAFEHLLQHGHRQIAFIAGKSGRGGDSAERLAAYRQALRESGIAEDQRLVAYGEHRKEDGRAAMQQILASGANFTALMASNDLSCIGAVEALREAGKRVPEDVAVIGFDDILDARSHRPPLTTVRHPTFSLGYEAVLTLLAGIESAWFSQPSIRVPTQLIVRQSCGCHPESTPTVLEVVSKESNLENVVCRIARSMVEAAWMEARPGRSGEVEFLCTEIIRAFFSSLQSKDLATFDAVLRRLSSSIEEQAEDTHDWQEVISTFRRQLFQLLHFVPQADPIFADTLIDRARLAIGDHIQRKATERLLQHIEMTNRLGLLTSQMMSMIVADRSESAKVLANHLPQLGLQQAVVVSFSQGEYGSLSQGTIILDVGFPQSATGKQFPAQSFPPPGLFPPDIPFQLALLPLMVDDQTSGLLALSAANLEPGAAIAYHLTSAFRTARLYREAREGQRMAEEASLVKSRFLSVVSHELRTPLSLVVGLSDTLLNDEMGNPGLSGAALANLEQLRLNAQHLSHMIDDVIDLTGSETGQLRILREPTDLAEVLHVAVSIGELMAREKGLAWRARIPAYGPWVMGNRTRLRQVVINLINNAVKFTSTGAVSLEVDVNEKQATVAVSDTGPGVPVADEVGIFDEYNLTARTVQPGLGGLGLGLAISKKLVEQHEGQIGVRSPGDLGRGSTFFFTLPLLPSSDGRANQKDPDAAPVAFGGIADPDWPIVLVVEDDSRILDFYGQLVERAGFKVIKARHGREALDIVAHTRPAMILLDLMMPVMDGFAMLDALRARETTRDIPVIVLTARSLSESDLARLGQGVAAILGKGLFNSSELLKHIEEALKPRIRLGNVTKQLVRRAMAYIHEHYTEPISRGNIAGQLGISADYLTYCFRQEFGITPIAYLNRYRISQARALLENGVYSVKRVALMVGFTESAHFTRIFKREVGLTPRDYRSGRR